MFDRWHFQDGRLGLPGIPAMLPRGIPDQEQLQEAEEAVRQQADAVRSIKMQPEIQVGHCLVIQVAQVRGMGALLVHA